jgi:hypothetical protein
MMQPHATQHTGVYWTCRSEYAQNVITNHKELGRNDDIIALPVADPNSKHLFVTARRASPAAAQPLALFTRTSLTPV